MSFSYDFMFDRIMCVLVRIKVRGHLVMSIIQFMNLISVHFWTYLITPDALKGHTVSKNGSISFYAGCSEGAYRV